jgi:hypothetical protein
MTTIEFLESHFWELWWLVAWLGICLANWGVKK